jgi:hypothetical protein
MFLTIKSLPRALVMFAGAILIFSMAACGGGSSAPSAADAAPVATAITAYLEKQSIEMKVAEVKELKIDGETAKASASLAQADEVYNLKVTWSFELKKSGTGWEVTSHSDK